MSAAGIAACLLAGCVCMVLAMARWSCADEAELARWDGVMLSARCRRESRRAARRRRLRRIWMGLAFAWRAAAGRRATR